MHKKVYFVGRQSMYKAIEKIASEEFELVFKKEKKWEEFRRMSKHSRKFVARFNRACFSRRLNGSKSKKYIFFILH